MPKSASQEPTAAVSQQDPELPLDGSPDQTNAADRASIASAAALIRSNLAAMPSASKVSLRALVVVLRPELLQARRDGRSWKQIADAFAAAGFAAEPDTIRIYARTATSTKAARAAKRAVVIKPATSGTSDTPGATIMTSVSMATPGLATIATDATTGTQNGSIRSDGARITPRVR